MSAPTAEDFAKLPPKSTPMHWEAPNSQAEFWVAVVQPVNRRGAQLLEWEEGTWVVQPGVYSMAAMLALGYRVVDVP